MPDESKAAREQELREILTDFWLGAVAGEEQGAEFPDRIKASELLAKFILGEGKTPVKRRGPQRPPTRSVLEEIDRIEKDTYVADLPDEDDGTTI